NVGRTCTLGAGLNRRLALAERGCRQSPARMNSRAELTNRGRVRGRDHESLFPYDDTFRGHVQPVRVHLPIIPLNTDPSLGEEPPNGRPDRARESNTQRAIYNSFRRDTSILQPTRTRAPESQARCARRAAGVAVQFEYRWKLARQRLKWLSKAKPRSSKV